MFRFSPSYTKYVEGLLPPQAILKDRYGNVWNVKIGRLGDQICIVDGWLTFAEQNFLEFGDMVVFHYNGEKVFYVTILGDSFLEKKGVGRFKYDGITEEEDDGEEREYGRSGSSSGEEREYGRSGSSSGEEREYGRSHFSPHLKSDRQTQNLAGFHTSNKNKSGSRFNHNLEEEVSFEDQEDTMIFNKYHSSHKPESSKRKNIAEFETGKREMEEELEYFPRNDAHNKNKARRGDYSNLKEAEPSQNHSSRNPNFPYRTRNSVGFDSYYTKEAKPSRDHSSRNPNFPYRTPKSAGVDSYYTKEAKPSRDHSSRNPNFPYRTPKLVGFDSYYTKEAKPSRDHSSRNPNFPYRTPKSAGVDSYYTKEAKPSRDHSSHNPNFPYRTPKLVEFDSYYTKEAKPSRDHSSRNPNFPYRTPKSAGFDSYYTKEAKPSRDRSSRNLNFPYRNRNSAGFDSYFSAHHSQSRKRTRDSSDEDESENEFQPQRERRIDPFGRDLITSGRIQRPENPYFVTRLKKHRWNEMFIPAEFMTTYGINLPQSIDVYDPAGEKRTARYSRWANGRRLYIGGWRDLCRANFIGNDDLCICEFRRNGDNKLYIQVKTIRSAYNLV